MEKRLNFKIDTNKAGLGTLQTTFDGAAQPIDFQLVSCVERVFRYRYLVSQAGECTIDVKWIGNHRLVLQFAGEPIPDSPILFHVNDPAQVKLDINPSSPQTTPMNKIFELHANTETCGEGHMTAKATSPKLRPVK